MLYAHNGPPGYRTQGRRRGIPKPVGDLVVVSELRRVELPAGSTADLGFGCPPVTVVVRAVQLVRGPSAAQGEEETQLLLI
jgi:hypothetical protein